MVSITLCDSKGTREFSLWELTRSIVVVTAAQSLHYINLSANRQRQSALTDLYSPSIRQPGLSALPATSPLQARISGSRIDHLCSDDIVLSIAFSSSPNTVSHGQSCQTTDRDPPQPETIRRSEAGMYLNGTYKLLRTRLVPGVLLS